MHEHHLMAGLIKKVEEIARREKAKSVSAVQVWLGALSHFSEEHFRGHFEQASAGTLAEGARLQIELSRDPAHPDAQGVLVKKVKLKM